MKLALARAMLFKADILLLDEPTNHLDVVNVAWLESYLTGLTTCTSIIVSHDSGFLNNTITDVLHLNRFKLRRYRGNLEKFVQAVPEAKSYYSLEALEDYSTPRKPFSNFTILLSKSRFPPVSPFWANGSGKSTLVKLLIGDMEPNKGGEIWKHPNLVIGYVAQHAFHHIDNHLDKTPSSTCFGVTRLKRLIDEIITRKKLKQSYEYEVSFKGLSSSENIWLPRDDLIKRGFEKKVIEVDTREAQRAGLLRPLVRREIEKHFADFDYLDRESLAALIEALKVFEVVSSSSLTTESSPNPSARSRIFPVLRSYTDILRRVWAMRDGHLEASGHNWVEGQGSGPRIDQKGGEDDDHTTLWATRLMSRSRRNFRRLNNAKRRRSVWHERREVRMTLSNIVFTLSAVERTRCSSIGSGMRQYPFRANLKNLTSRNCRKNPGNSPCKVSLNVGRFERVSQSTVGTNTYLIGKKNPYISLIREKVVRNMCRFCGNFGRNATATPLQTPSGAQIPCTRDATVSPHTANTLPSIIARSTRLLCPSTSGDAFHDLSHGQSMLPLQARFTSYTPWAHRRLDLLIRPGGQSTVTADTILGQGTAVFEDLASYISSLQSLLEFGKSEGRDFASLYPGHGPSFQMVQALSVGEGGADRTGAQRVVPAEERTTPPQSATTWNIVSVIYAAYPESLWGLLLIALICTSKIGEGRESKKLGAKGKTRIAVTVIINCNIYVRVICMKDNVFYVHSLEQMSYF
ncbi:translational elongation factor [Salix suchowensis]|nr:translational elongation factor [Salix suchowensis]